MLSARGKIIVKQVYTMAADAPATQGPGTSTIMVWSSLPGIFRLQHQKFEQNLSFRINPPTCQSFFQAKFELLVSIFPEAEGYFITVA